MNETVLPQLQTIEAELASQESQLTAQLDALREKLKGVRAVLPMFEEGMLADLPDLETPASETTKTVEKASKSESSASKSTTSASETVKATEPKKTARKATKKKDGRAASWQKYTRKGVEQQSMPDAVLLILQTQPEKSFKIADVMSAIFEDDMPKNQYLKARNRISNILSGGARDGQWHRGERSTYSLSK
ncbi:MAG: hypothetical protein WBC73_11780 [Phormidesmis sp.]